MYISLTEKTLNSNLVVERFIQMEKERYIWKDESEYQEFLKQNEIAVHI